MASSNRRARTSAPVRSRSPARRRAWHPLKKVGGACGNAVKACRKAARRPRKISNLRFAMIALVAFGVGWLLGGGPVPAGGVLSRVQVQSPIVIAPADNASR